MLRIELAPFNGQFADKGTMRRIRRKVEGPIRQGQCVLLDMEDTRELPLPELREIVADQPEDKLRVCGCIDLLPFPLPPSAILPPIGV